jgi:acetyl esterase/lipase
MRGYGITGAALAVVIGMAGGCAQGQTAMTRQGAARPVTADISGAVVSADRFPATTAAFPGGVTARPDVVYWTPPGGFQPQTLDLYRPAGEGPHPLVIYVHGGGWVGGTARNAGTFENFPGVLADLASRGYVVASVNYRLAGEARFPGAIQDVKAAVRYLRANAASLGVDPDKVLIWGSSAGGQLAGLVDRKSVV